MDVSPHNERRVHPRFHFDRRLAVLVDHGEGHTECVQGRCNNLSMGGVGAVLARKLENGQQVLLEFSGNVEQGAVRLPACVSYRHDLSYGFRFADLDRAQAAELERLVGIFFCSQMV